MQKKLAVLAMLLGFFIFLPAAVLAADRTTEVAPKYCVVEVNNANTGVYQDIAVNKDYPKSNMAIVSIQFRNNRLGYIRQKDGDSVNFFIKANIPQAVGWVDKNINSDYESNESIDSAQLNSAQGYYVQNARLTSSSKATFYIGAVKPGIYKVYIYADSQGRPGEIIGSFTLTVENNGAGLTLTAYDEDGQTTLGKHNGSVQDPFELIPGEYSVLKAALKTGSIAIPGKTIKFYQSVNGEPFTEIGSEETDNDGFAEIDIKAEKSGIYQFYAVYDGIKSNIIHIKYAPEKASRVKAKTPDNSIVAVNENFTVEFYLEDKYNNRIPSDVKEVVRFDVVNAPSKSKYSNFGSQEAKSDKDGKVSFNFKPDIAGKYTIRCQLVDGNGRDSVTIEAVKFGEVKDINFTLLSDTYEISSVRYIDNNGDSLPEVDGRLQVEFVDDKGAKVIGNGKSAYNPIFISTNPKVVTVEYDGDIIVNDKNFRGIVPITVMDKAGTVSKTYNLQVSGPAAALSVATTIDGRKADLILQYVDDRGNKTRASAGEAFTLTYSSKVGEISKENFNWDGKATCSFLVEEYGSQQVTVTTNKLNLKKVLNLEFIAEKTQTETGRKVVMFIGTKSFLLNGTPMIMDVAPFIKEGRTFAAVRPIADSFGAEINWDPVQQIVTLTRENTTVKVKIGSNVIQTITNGVVRTVQADVPAFIEEGRTVLPFRAIGEAFNATVDYDPVTRAVTYQL